MAAHQHHGAEKVTKASIGSAMVDMNMTPMIDVLLVLLVIFMVTLPLAQRGLDINIPKETRPDTPSQPSEQIVLTFTADRRLSINNQDVGLLDLQPRLREIFEQRREKVMFIIGAGTLRYGEVIQVIDAAKGAGVERVGIVTEGMRGGGAGSAAPSPPGAE